MFGFRGEANGSIIEAIKHPTVTLRVCYRLKFSWEANKALESPLFPKNNCSCV